MAQIIAVVSGKGGVGKTTVTANLGVALAAMGKSVLLIDGDVGLRNLDISLGLQDKIVYHFNDVINGLCTAKQAIVTYGKFAGLRLLSAPQSVAWDDVDKAGFKKLIAELRNYYDYILIDCAAGIDDSFITGVESADRVLIIATPELISIRDADRVALNLERMQISQIHLIINRINIDMVKKGDMIDIDTIINTVAVPLIGAVPDESAVIISNNTGKPVVLSTKSRAGKAFLNIAKRITGEKIPILKDERKGLLKFFRK